MAANRLIHEQSPYLLQHAHNPVDWYPWGDEAFERARKENKPVLVSIGYAACHWCHVMERESFENEEVAAYMNARFICVKVDREEHPDVDHLYMDALQALTGSGGWPLNVFTTPDRAPFYGGTYFPPQGMYNRPSWMQLMIRITEIWEKRQEEVQLQAEQMLEHLKQASRMAAPPADMAWNMETCGKIAATLLQQADRKFGGFGAAPKFPGTMAIGFLLEHYHYSGDQPALTHALHSLDAMMNGGIYDQLNGGFARYSTDAYWLAPHFEKMLYDNALLITVYADAFAITKNKDYKEVVYATVAFIEKELKSPSGGYFSALDADSEGVEGKFYTWTMDEWTAAAGMGEEAVAAYFGVLPEGNWEHTNILHVARSKEDICQAFGLTPDVLDEHILRVKERLLEARNGRIRPITDDKSILSCNALMNIALTKAAAVFSDVRLEQRALEHMQWMKAHFIAEDGRLMHTWKDGKARIAAKLDDYAYWIQSMLQLGSLSGRLEWIEEAISWIGYVEEHFSVEDGICFYYTSDQQADIPVRKVEQYDGATPSANAVMAHNLMLAGLVMENNNWLERAFYMLKQMAPTTIRYPYSFGYWAVLLQRYAREWKTVVLTGTGAQTENKALHACFLPECYPVASEKKIFSLPILKEKVFTTKTYIFVCTQHHCLAPVTGVDDVLTRVLN